MYVATFRTDNGYVEHEYTIEGSSLEKIVSRFQAVQDLDCLVRMGRLMGDTDDEKALDGLENFLIKFYAGKLNLEDLRDFEVNLSAGSIKCLKVEEK